MEILIVTGDTLTDVFCSNVACWEVELLSIITGNYPWLAREYPCVRDVLIRKTTKNKRTPNLNLFSRDVKALVIEMRGVMAI